MPGRVAAQISRCARLSASSRCARLRRRARAAGVGEEKNSVRGNGRAENARLRGSRHTPRYPRTRRKDMDNLAGVQWRASTKCDQMRLPDVTKATPNATRCFFTKCYQMLPDVRARGGAGMGAGLWIGASTGAMVGVGCRYGSRQGRLQGGRVRGRERGGIGGGKMLPTWNTRANQRLRHV